MQKYLLSLAYFPEMPLALGFDLQHVPEYQPAQRIEILLVPTPEELALYEGLALGAGVDIKTMPGPYASGLRCTFIDFQPSDSDLPTPQIWRRPLLRPLAQEQKSPTE